MQTVYIMETTQQWMYILKAGVVIFLFGCCLFVPENHMILQMLRDEPAPDDRWAQESGPPSLFFECRSHKLWPCIILPIIWTQKSAHWLPDWGLWLKKDKTESLLSYFVSKDHPLCLSFFFLLLQLCFSRHKPTNCISRYSSPMPGLVVYDQKPISSGSNEKKKSGQSSRER